MPTYQYSCTECGHALEQFQSFSDDALTVCPQCEGRLRKVYNAVGVVFKGSGFYRTDSRSDADKARSSDKESSDGGSSKTEKSGGDSGTAAAATKDGGSAGSDKGRSDKGGDKGGNTSSGKSGGDKAGSGASTGSTGSTGSTSAA